MRGVSLSCLKAPIRTVRVNFFFFFFFFTYIIPLLFVKRRSNSNFRDGKGSVSGRTRRVRTDWASVISPFYTLFIQLRKLGEIRNGKYLSHKFFDYKLGSLCVVFHIPGFKCHIFFLRLMRWMNLITWHVHSTTVSFDWTLRAPI